MASLGDENPMLNILESTMPENIFEYLIECRDEWLEDSFSCELRKRKSIQQDAPQQTAEEHAL